VGPAGDFGGCLVPGGRVVHNFARPAVSAIGAKVTAIVI
jgi:hypothetical protein